MKLLTCLSVLLFVSFFASGEVAIIKDKDGYTNVRKKPDSQSEVIHKIYRNEVFWYYEEINGKKGEWVSVHIQKNAFSLNSSPDFYLEGYIHRSHLQPLEKLPVYRGKDFSFRYDLKPFDPTNRIIDRTDSKSIIAIDGRPVWGQDGDLPNIQVNAIQVTIEGRKIVVSKPFFSDLYECTYDFNVYKNGDTYFVSQYNSDAAGAYNLVWAFTREGLKQRLVGGFC